MQRNKYLLEAQYGNPEKPNYIPDKLIYQFLSYLGSKEELNQREYNENQECDNFDHENNIENVANQDENNSVGKFGIFHQREKEALILSPDIAS